MLEIHIAFGISDQSGEYSKFVGTTILSIVKNTKSNIVIHILHDGTINALNKDYFLEMSEKYRFKILFYLVSVPLEIKKLKSLGYLTIGTILRLAIVKYCQVDKIIYLDGDILVNLDIQLIWDIDISNYYIAAVNDKKDTRIDYIKRKYYQNIGYDCEYYFNAGVLYFNCKNISNSFDMWQKCFDVLKKYKYLIFADQDALNYVFQGKVLFMEERFNLIVDSDESLNLLPLNSIVHFAGYFKPWNCVNREIIKLYYSYMFETPWADNHEKIIISMSEISKNHFNKMDLRRSLIKKGKGSDMQILIMLFLKIVIGDRNYANIIAKMIKIRRKILYDFIYRI